jgi:nucleotide-binding universal stress UspA family protein
MPYKTILVQARADDAGTRAVSVAKTLARMFEAAILGVAAEAFDDTVYGDAAGELIAAERALVENDVTAARKSFHDLTKDWPFGASCVSSPEAPLDVMIRHARGADLIVACRPPGRGKAASDCGPAALVMQTGLPVLLAADGGVELKAEHILVAWRDQREAIRAVGDALPLLIRARTVHLVSVSPADRQDQARASLEEVKRRLGRHGVAVETDIVTQSGNVTDDLDSAAERARADLIVAGAYSHNRVREWALGGVTQDLIAGSRKFVLLSR